jgi:hypothetical protein
MLGCQPIRNLHQVDIKTCTKYGIYPPQGSNTPLENSKFAPEGQSKLQLAPFLFPPNNSAGLSAREKNGK